VTTLDALPAEGFRDGETYQVGYTIRQHGQTPFPGADTEIRITSPTTGESHAFAGNAEGERGHYVAEIRFPSAGEWAWEVKQAPFAPRQLGTVTVASASASTQPASTQALSSSVRPEMIAVLSALALMGLLAFRPAPTARGRRPSRSV
jgi:hypothetical protein